LSQPVSGSTLITSFPVICTLTASVNGTTFWHTAIQRSVKNVARLAQVTSVRRDLVLCARLTVVDDAGFALIRFVVKAETWFTGCTYTALVARQSKARLAIVADRRSYLIAQSTVGINACRIYALVLLQPVPRIAFVAHCNTFFNALEAFIDFTDRVLTEALLDIELKARFTCRAFTLIVNQDESYCALVTSCRSLTRAFLTSGVQA